MYISLSEFKARVGDGTQGLDTRGWIREGKAVAYLRLNQHAWKDGELVSTVDFANSGTPIGDLKGHGYFATFMQDIQKWAAELNRCVYVQSVYSRRFDAVLTALPGWERWCPDNGAPNFLYRPES